MIKIKMIKIQTVVKDRLIKRKEGLLERKEEMIKQLKKYLIKINLLNSDLNY
jgi:hypothetical protein